MNIHRKLTGVLPGAPVIRMGCFTYDPATRIMFSSRGYFYVTKTEAKMIMILHEAPRTEMQLFAELKRSLEKDLTIKKLMGYLSVFTGKMREIAPRGERGLVVRKIYSLRES